MEQKLEILTSNLEEKINEEIKKNQEKIKQLIQQSRLAQMGEMISMIAHQWRQPLTAITATTNNLQLRSLIDGKIDTTHLQEELELITNYSQHLSFTIDDFRNFFKPDKIKTNFNISDVIENTIKLMGSQFKNNNIELIKNINNAELYGYYNELLQVLINILKNAKDELIKLDTNKRRIIFIDTYTDKSNLIIKIRDNANGIPPDIIEKIFEPYFTTKENDEGTGIGLYMCKQIIDGMTGKIQVINVEYE